MDILIEFASESCVQDLYASAYSKNRYLTVGSKARKQEFLHIAFVIDAVKFHNRFFTQQKRIDVTSAAQQQPVDTVKQFAQVIHFLVRRDD
jgi:hypothetical protein